MKWKVILRAFIKKNNKHGGAWSKMNGWGHAPLSSVFPPTLAGCFPDHCNPHVGSFLLPCCLLSYSRELYSGIFSARPRLILLTPKDPKMEFSQTTRQSLLLSWQPVPVETLQNNSQSDLMASASSSITPSPTGSMTDLASFSLRGANEIWRHNSALCLQG